MTEGYIKLHRSLLNKSYINKPDYLSIWVFLLLLANHKDTSFVFNNQTQVLKAGQLITGRKQLSRNSGIAESQVYKILNFLETQHQIKQQKNNKFTLITILNWQKHQSIVTTKEQEKEQPSNNQVTTKEQQSNTYKKSTKNDKNEKNDKNKDINIPKIKYLDFVSMTEEEHQKLIDKYGETNTKAFIEKLSIWKGANGKTKARGSDYLKILNWVVEAVLSKEGNNRTDKVFTPVLKGVKYEPYD